MSRDKLWLALKEYNVSKQLLSAMQSLYENGWARVRVGERESPQIQVRKGVRQGCPLSPWLLMFS